ncbi:hypothetical protein SS05631_c37840 [Sinorhizobium sp. CCBAU 05631]|nr:hypothetical protein SS05631_c37840 [Sinorhizobium sp. CCBAU 05631]
MAKQRRVLQVHGWSFPQKKVTELIQLFSVSTIVFCFSGKRLPRRFVPLPEGPARQRSRFDDFL